jgi:diguanylate cyclase (GGDEF)-like protein
MQQFSWISLVDAMFLESALRRDVVGILIEGLGLDSNQSARGQLDHLGHASFECSQPNDLEVTIPLSPSRMITVQASCASNLSELQLFAHLVQLALKTAERRESLVVESMSDPLTSLCNRRGFEHYIKSKQSSRGVLVFVDVDRLKQVNQRFGYQSADEKLKTLGAILGAAFRSTDCVCRWGGDEFLMFLKESDQSAAEIRVREVITEIREATALTISFGIAEVNLAHHDQNLLTEALEKAQEAMKDYRAVHS